MLSPNHARFIDELLKTHPRNGAAAYKLVYPNVSDTTAKANAHRLLKNPRVAAEIARRDKELSDKAGLSAERIREELKLLNFSSIADYVIDDTGNLAPAPGKPADVMRAVSSLKRRQITQKDGSVVTEIEFKLWDKPGTLRTSAQHRGMLTEKHEHTGKDGAPLNPVPQKITVELVKPS